ncbi:MAG TPA: glutathione S-transferase family protein [Paracoccaceae bacterium]|nr:glutathione S-transferase family protein [Paracoccaceae bacterium]
MPSPLTLYFAPQTCARVSLTALAEIGQPFDTRLIAFMAGEHRQPAYLQLNPSGKVPALVTGSGVVTQTGAILGFLAQAYPEAGLLPVRRDPVSQAQVTSWLFRCSADLHPLVTRFVLPAMITAQPQDAAPIREKAAEMLAAQLQPIDHSLGRTEWVLEEGWSMIDAYLAWIWFRITGAGFDPARFPHIERHYRAAGERPSALAALAIEDEAQAELKGRGLFFSPPTSSQPTVSDQGTA